MTEKVQLRSESATLIKDRSYLGEEATAMEPKQVVLEFFASAGRQDKETTKTYLAPDVVWNDNGPPEMIGGGHFHNADEVIDYIWGNIRDTRELRITPQWIIASEDKVVALINEHAVIVNTGRYYNIDSIHVYTVLDGRIANFNNYFDPMPLLRATYDIDFKKPSFKTEAL